MEALAEGEDDRRGDQACDGKLVAHRLCEHDQEAGDDPHAGREREGADAAPPLGRLDDRDLQEHDRCGVGQG